MKVKRIGVLTSGGDAPGMNAFVRSVVRSALHHGLEVYGIRRGWHGLIQGDVQKLDEKSVTRIINRGGTILYTARSMEFMTEEGQRKAASVCKFLGLDSIIAIGGDGTFRGAQALSKFGVNVIGIPATIDNDIGCTNYCLGFDTAANTSIECIDKLRDTMQSHERCSVVEVMGRHAGFLAMYVGLAVGATAVLVPEHPLCRSIETGSPGTLRTEFGWLHIEFAHHLYEVCWCAATEPVIVELHVAEGIKQAVWVENVGRWPCEMITIVAVCQFCNDFIVGFAFLFCESIDIIAELLREFLFCDATNCGIFLIHTHVLNIVQLAENA